MTSLRVLTWNLMHGRAQPPAARYLLDDFSAALSSWRWDVALLQEVPPWWPALLADRLHADPRLIKTSRNALLRVRRGIAVRWPDLIKSNGGGANAILVRELGIVEDRALRLRWLPERRWVHAVKLSTGIWVANLHLTVHDDAAAREEAARAARTLQGWAGGSPALLGGDFNVRAPALPGFEHLGGHDVDHVFGSGAHFAADTEVPARGVLSDHAPVLIDVRSPALGYPGSG